MHAENSTKAESFSTEEAVLVWLKVNILKRLTILSYGRKVLLYTPLAGTRNIRETH